MVRKQKAIPDTVTPTRRSARIKEVAPAQTAHGERFRSLLTVCEDYIPVANVVGVDCPVDDVVVSPPPTKRTRRKIPVDGLNNNTRIETATVDVADIPLPPAFAWDNIAAAAAATTAAPAGVENNSDIPLPAFASAVAPNLMLNDDSSENENANDDGCGNDDRKLPAQERDTDMGDEMSAIPEGDDDDNDDEDGINAFLSSYGDEDNMKNGGGDDDDGDVGEDAVNHSGGGSCGE